MQIVIELSEKDYKSLNRYINFNLENEDGRILSAVKHGTVFPENSTNGDIMKTLFPTIRIDDGGEWRHIFWGVQAKASFSQDWWNTPYKTESEE